MNVIEQRPPGWDPRAISQVATDVFGGYREMFEYHGWPERGQAMMPNACKRVKEHYGSVESFVVQCKGLTLVRREPNS